MRTGLACLIVVCLLSSPSGAVLVHAQEPVAVSPEVEAALATARPGRNVAVTLADGHTVRGKFKALEGDRIAVRVERAFRRRQLRTYALDEVTELRWRRSDLAQRAIGAAIGLGVSLGGLALLLRAGY